MGEGADAVSEADELARARAGDHDALRLLVRRHQPAVFRVAFAVLRDRSDAEDVAQEAWLLFWLKRSQVRLYGRSVLPWLIATVRYLAMNRVRKLGNRGLLQLRDDVPETQRDHDPEHAAAAKELRASLDAAIGGLDPVDQDLVVLCLMRDLSYKQAAARLGLTHSVVRNRLSRARARMRAELGDYLGEET